MLDRSETRNTPLSALLLLLALAPFQLAAKGCSSATVGEDDACAPGETCSTGGTGGTGGLPAGECGGLSGLTCTDGEYCDYAPSAACGAADQPGVCRTKPEGCVLIYAPVCGCDDQTYGNVCEAQRAGVSVAREGECETTGEPSCGGLTGATCADGEFCNYAPGAACGAADATGVCEPIPELCTGDYTPVCGCDDVTYSNACMAHGAGVSVARSGACDEAPPNGDACGGLEGATCADGEFCSYGADAQCGAADATGVCAPMPEACDAVYDPVCGCDDVTYGNECEANTAGVSVARTGACDDEPPTGTICGGLLGAECPADQYCNYAIEAQCGNGDMTGTCAVMPEGCTLEYAPVCGCDGKTYSNSCAAASAGVSLAPDDTCH